jgi:hypothetical protein
MKLFVKNHLFFITFALAIAGLLPLTSNAKLTPAVAGPWFGQDDKNTSTLNPNTVNGGNNTPTWYTDQCQWITTTMDAFCAANTNYKWNWAVPNFDLKADLTVTDYYAWVVDSPDFVNGFDFTGESIKNADVGGCAFGLTYKPDPCSPDKNIFFIQACIDNDNGVQGVATLDNNEATLTPWYGGASSYGTFDSEYKMGDAPSCQELESDEPPDFFYGEQFQTVVAYDNVINDVNNLTLYQGAEWWGYNYTTTDVPEPATFLLLGLGSLALLRKRR